VSLFKLFEISSILSGSEWWMDCIKSHVDTIN
jgi:hypothetical protein